MRVATESGELREWIRATRRAKGITQAQLATSSGLRQSTIAKIELDQHGISWDNGWRLIAALESFAVPAIDPPPIPARR